MRTRLPWKMRLPWLGPRLFRASQVRKLLGWLDSSDHGKPPHLIKQALVHREATRHRLRTFVETGTFFGDMAWAMRRRFERIVTIELSPELARGSRERLRPFRHIELLEGDSAEVLPRVLATLTTPALFWLDAHFSGGVTARGSVDSPIERELDAVLAHPVAGHVVLVDDVDDFSGSGGYPRLPELRQRLHAAGRPS